MKKLYKPLNKGIKRILTIVSVLLPIVFLMAVGDDIEEPIGVVFAIIIPLFLFWLAVFIFLWIRDGFVNP